MNMNNGEMEHSDLGGMFYNKKEALKEIESIKKKTRNEIIASTSFSDGFIPENKLHDLLDVVFV